MLGVIVKARRFHGMNRIQKLRRISFTCGIRAVLLLCVSVAAAQTWVQQFPTGTPPSPRTSNRQAYDQAHDRLILFSGDPAGLPKPNDVWILANATGAAGTPSWIQLLPNGSPGPEGRWGATAVYDPGSNRMIVQGGCFGHCQPIAYDTWVLTNANGLEANPPEWIHIADLPIGLSLHCAVYDESSNRMMVFGGNTGWLGTQQNNVWILHDANGIGTPAWELLSSIGARPLPRDGCSAVYDHASNRMIIFGGTYYDASWSESYNDVWALTNANGLGGTSEWVQLIPSGIPPSKRHTHSALFDPTTQRMIVFGGRMLEYYGTYFNDTWVLTAANGVSGTPEWIQLSPAGTLPHGRAEYSAAYSLASNRMVVAMGYYYSPYTLMNDVWVLQNANGIPHYKFSGFFPPVNTEAWNTPNAGQSVPLKWQLRTADDTLISDLAVVSATTSGPLACPAGSASSSGSFDSADSPGLKYDPVAEQYVFVWKTQKSWGGTCRRFVLKLNDGSIYTADFAFR
jgi:hypothetical protein